MVGILAIIAGIVDIPAAADEMNFRRPYFAAVASRRRGGPEGFDFAINQASERARSAEQDGAPPLPIKRADVVIKTVVANDPRISTADQEAIDVGSVGHAKLC